MPKLKFTLNVEGNVFHVEFVREQVEHLLATLAKNEINVIDSAIIDGADPETSIHAVFSLQEDRQILEALSRASFKTVAELLICDERDLRCVRGIDRAMARRILSRLHELGYNQAPATT